MLSLVASPTRTGEGSLRKIIFNGNNKWTDIRLDKIMGKSFNKMSELISGMCREKMGQLKPGIKLGYRMFHGARQAGKLEIKI